MGEPARLVTEPPNPEVVHADVPTVYSVLESEHGRTIIHGDVVAKIASIAVREIDGVHSLAPFGASQTMTAFARRLLGSTMRKLGVQVEVGRLQAAIDVRIVTNYGRSIVTIAQAIRDRVREQVEWMTGLDVVEVNVEVVDLYFPPADLAPRRPAWRHPLPS